MPTFDLADVFTPAGLAALGQVIAIDLMLAGDNVVVLGTLAAGLPARDRRRVLGIGIGLSLICLLAFAWFATRLLAVVGLLFAGGLLLLWVAWKLWRELRGARGKVAGGAVSARRSLLQAAVQVALADLSMSLDNVLAVAGAARGHPTVLFFGLALSVTLMAVAASLIARVIERHRWIAYAGLAVIVYVAAAMLYQGWSDPAIGLDRLFRRG